MSTTLCVGLMIVAAAVGFWAGQGCAYRKCVRKTTVALEEYLRITRVSAEELTEALAENREKVQRAMALLEETAFQEQANVPQQPDS